jgi:hypothetical protein
VEAVVKSFFRPHVPILRFIVLPERSQKAGGRSKFKSQLLVLPFARCSARWVALRQCAPNATHFTLRNNARVVMVQRADDICPVHRLTSLHTAKPRLASAVEKAPITVKFYYK